MRKWRMALTGVVEYIASRILCDSCNSCTNRLQIGIDYDYSAQALCGGRCAGFNLAGGRRPCISSVSRHICFGVKVAAARRPLSRHPPPPARPCSPVTCRVPAGRAGLRCVTTLISRGHVSRHPDCNLHSHIFLIWRHAILISNKVST